MIEYLEIGPVPAGEDCAQVGSIDFRNQSKREMRAYINQLKREFPAYDEHNVRFVAKYFPHDFGSYGEVCVEYDTDDEVATTFAFKVDNFIPMQWDEEALEELDDSF